MTYTAPTDDIRFALNQLAQLSRLEGNPHFSAYDPDLIEPILDEAGKLASEARKMFPVSEANPPFRLYAASTIAEAESIYAGQMAQIDGMDGVSVLHPPAAVTRARPEG